MINLTAYAIIGFAISTFLIIKFIWGDRDCLGIDIIVNDIAEALIVGLGWIVSIPILVISNIVLFIICCIYILIIGKEDENNE